MPLSRYLLCYVRRGITIGGFSGLIMIGPLFASGYLGRSIWSFAAAMGLEFAAMIIGAVVADCVYWRRHKTIVLPVAPADELARDLPADSA